MPVQPPDTTSPVATVGASGAGVATFARQANATAYAALQVVSSGSGAGSILTFPTIARVNGAGGYIVKAKLQTDQSTNVARFRLHLFTVANPNLPADAAACALKWADAATYVGPIDFDALKTEGAGSDTAYSVNTTVRMHFTCAPADRQLYGILETLDAFTPTSGQNFRIALAADDY